MRRLSGLLSLTCILFAACGSGGGGGDGGGNGGPNPPLVTLYVRQSGNDDAIGTSPEEALKTVTRAAQFLAPGVTVYVGPGFYEGGVDIAGIDTTERAPVQLIADPEGEFTGDAPGEVVIDADEGIFAVRVSRTPFVLIDGFILVGADSGQTAVHIRSNSSGATVQNCVISNAGPADGIRVQDSDDVLIFNNLIFDNNRGIRIGNGSQNARIINNSIVENGSTAVSIGGVNGNNEASSGATLRNNIIQGSRNNVSIAVDDGPPSARAGYSGNFNLAFAPDLGDQTKTYRPAVLQGLDDVNEDALFVDLEDGDFHLSSDSPARDSGSGDIGGALLNALLERSTSSNDQLDVPPVDIGYHYPVPTR
jgi:parallel beta-helix repeat protein